VVLALVEERAANRSFEGEPALLGDAARGGVLGNDHQVNAIPRLGGEQVVHQQLDGLRRITATGEALTIKLVRELERNASQ
jgi:hypothetical protein